ncbi:TlpA family protein disulfide reductase [Halomonas sp. WWR20]
MDALALGPLLISLPRVYAFAAALALLLSSVVILRLPRSLHARWYNGLLLTAIVGARLGHVAAHLAAYMAAPWDILKFWQPGYSPVGGLVAAALWTVWVLRRRLIALAEALLLLLSAGVVWMLLMMWNPLADEMPLAELPDLTLERLDGRQVNLSDLAGQRLVINLWATWCPPCLREMPLLAEADARDDVSVIMINQGESLLQVVRFLDDQGLSFEHSLLDPRQQLMALTQSPGLPTSLLFDRQGRLQNRHVGELSRSQLQEWLAH